MKSYLLLGLVAVTGACAAPTDGSEEAVGSHEDSIINGTPIDPEGTPYALVNGGCSGSFLTNEWVLSAKHCFSSESATGVSIRVGTRTIAASEVLLHPDAGRDVALVRIATPMRINGSTTGYRRAIYTGTTESLKGKTAFCTGYGNNTYSAGFGTLRAMSSRIVDAKDGNIWFEPNSVGQIQWLGDSGGGCYVDGVQVGVQSFCSHVPATSSVVGCGQPSLPSVYGWVYAHAVSPGGADFNKDARADILWHNQATGDVGGWTMNGSTAASMMLIKAAERLEWRAIGAGDFDGDGSSDILWRNTTNGQVSAWLMDGTTIRATPAWNADLAWQFAGTGDFNADGKTDILFRNDTIAATSTWLVNGTTIEYGAPAYFGDRNWSVAGIADFNHDGKSDVLWRHQTNGDLAVWRMDGFAVSMDAPFKREADLNWQVVGVGDFDGDGHSDIFWNHRVTGAASIWRMSFSRPVTYWTPVSAQDTSWNVAGIADFDRDGKSDVLWRHATDGRVGMWLMNGGNATFTTVSTQPLDWRIVRTD